METETSYRPGRGFVAAVGVAMLVVGVLVAAQLSPILGSPIQPHLGGGSTVVLAGTVVMPDGVGTNTQLNYEPHNVLVIIGVNNTVTFANKDGTKHTVTARDHSFNSGDILPGQSWTHTFGTPGNYSFYCVYHTWMTGTIEVVQGTPGGASVVYIPAGTGSNNNLNYAPGTFTVVIGQNSTVIFVNQDSTKHTVTANDGSFNSGDILPGGTWSYMFKTPGTYSFHCIYHSWMKGTVTVVSG
jgi:plastocyanin